MAVTFDQVGALATDTFVTTLNVIVPSGLDTDDILIITVLARDNQVHTLPSTEVDGISAWSNFVEINNTTGLRTTLSWARVTNGTNASGNTVAITKPVDNNTLFAGVASSWKGCVTSGSPIDGTTPTTSPNASSDTVTYATFDPTGTDVHIIAIGTYANDLTTAGTISGTNPTLANRFDLETAAGGDGSIFCYSGDTSDGAATGARSHSTTSTLDAVNIGILFALKPVSTASAALTGTVTNDTEADIVTGGSTIILTLTGDTFIAAGTGPIGTTANTQALIDGITSAGAEGTGWNAVVRAGIETADVVRTSDTVATITLDAEATYNITANETITVTIPAAVLTGASPIVASPTFTVTAIVTNVPGTLLMMGLGV